MTLANYIKACRKNAPGNRQTVYLTEIENITSVTETNGIISAITMNSQSKFVRVQADIDTVQFTVEGTFTTSGGQTQNLIMSFGNRSTELETLIVQLIAAITCGIVAIWLDNNGKGWIGGITSATKEGKERPFNKLTTNFDSGLTITDENTARYTITLSRTSAWPVTELNATLTESIISGTATFINW